MTMNRYASIVLSIVFIVSSAGCTGIAPAAQFADTAGRVQPDSTSELVTATPRPSPTATMVPPTSTPTPLPASPTPTSSPASSTPLSSSAPQLRRLTTGGCCTQIFWSSDSQQIRFIDAPPPNGPAGIWSVDVADPASDPMLVTQELGYYTDDMEFRLIPGDETTTIVRVADGERWTVPADGFASISPNRTRIAWDESDRGRPWQNRNSELWVANFDGSDARQIDALHDSHVIGWVNDDVLLLEGEESRDADEELVYTYALDSGLTTEIARAENFRDVAVSPHGAWIAYYVIFSEEPDQNGLWLASTDGTDRRRMPVEFGAYQWRDSERLILIPFRPEAEFHVLWELDMTTGEMTQLTDLAETPIKIANADWAVSPDGRYVAYVDSRGDNIWMVTLE